MSDILGLIIDNKLLTILISIFGIFYGLITRMRTELNEKKKEFMEKVLVSQTSVNSFQNEIKEQLNHTPNLYKEELQRVLGFLDKHLEKLKFFSLKAFDKHLAFSIIYSFLFFYLSWLTGSNGAIGIYQIFLNENRLLLSMYIITLSIFLYIISIYIDKIKHFTTEKLYYFSQLNNITQQIILLSLIVGTILLISIFWIGIEQIPLFLPIISIFSLIQGLRNKDVSLIRDIRIITLNTGLTFMIFLPKIGITDKYNNILILGILFFLILPLLNAIFDYLSMQTSRYFAQKILYKHTKKFDIFLDIFWDLSVATLLFITLAFSLYYIIDFTNIYLIKDEALFIPIEHYKQLILAGNLLHPDILWITLMFVSTLIPTLIHLYLFIYALMAFVVVKPHLHQIVKELEELDLDNHHKKELVAYELADYRLTGWIRIHNFFLSALAIGFFVILGVLLSKLGFLN